MDDLRRRFSELDRMRVPDLWDAIELRAAAQVSTERVGAAHTPVPLPSRGSGRPGRLILVATGGLIVALMAGAFAVGSGIVKLPATVPVDASPSPTVPSAPTVSPVPTVSPTPTVPSATGDEIVRGWPDFGENVAGLYSWDGAQCGSSCIIGFMHNGYGSGDVEIRITANPLGSVSDDGAEAATVAGRDGHYRRLDALREEWFVDIEGHAITIRLKARSGASAADLAEAHAIIASMRPEPRDNGLGFRLVFRLTTNDWDSG